MKKLISAFFIAGFSTCAFGAAEWWLMPTICQPDNAECYPGWTTPVIDVNEWDVGAKCNGKKIVCDNAIKNPLFGPALSKAEISDSSIIDQDFDVGAAHPTNQCFGVRKTRNNGTEAKVGTEWRKVFCPGVLDDPDDVVTNGEIMLGTADQPTCESLADIGRIGVLNGQCYGKAGYFESDFHIECGGGLLPIKIVVLNGATINTAGANNPTTDEDANALFGIMIENAAEQQKLHSNP